VRDVDAAGGCERGDVVRLLGDQHRRASMAFAAFDELLEGVVVDPLQQLERVCQRAIWRHVADGGGERQLDGVAELLA
jgi:hypothetical protein